MVGKNVGFAIIAGLIGIASIAAAQSSEPLPAKLPPLTQDQYAIYLACVEESSLGSAKDGNPLATAAKLNALWGSTVKKTSLKGLTMLQLAQVTDSAVRALAAQQFGNAGKTGKVFKEFATETPAGCLTIAESLQQ
jgi:hypothetical protein